MAKARQIEIELEEGPELSNEEIDSLASLLFSLWRRSYESKVEDGKAKSGNVSHTTEKKESDTTGFRS